MVYYIDSQNYYHRGPLFAIPQILGLVELALIVMLIIETAKTSADRCSSRRCRSSCCRL